MTYKRGWEKLLLFSLGVMWGMQRTWGLNNKLHVWKGFGKALGEALRQGREGRFSLESVSPGWCSCSQLGLGTGNEGMAFPFPLVLSFHVSVTTSKCLSVENRT